MTETTTVMTCDDYREAVGADPTFDGGAAHLAQCPDCIDFRDSMLELDARIAEALRVPVPALAVPALPDADTANVLPLPNRRRVRPLWLAMAATVLVAAALGFRMFGAAPASAPTLGEQVLAHVNHESFSMRVSDAGVSAARLARIVPADMAKLDPADGLVTYAQSCVINGHVVPHLVMQGANGPVTILLMPYEAVDAPQAISDGELEGIILPVGNGSVAIVGRDATDLRRYEQTVKNSVTWST